MTLMKSLPRWFALLSFLSLAACGNDGGTGDGDAGPAACDSDGDGICDEDEVAGGTDPNNPDTDGDGINDGDEAGHGTDPTNPDTDGDGISDGDELIIGTDPTVADQACAQDEAQASSVSKPVDIIFVVDNSSSMSGEILGVQNNISTNFSSIIEASGINYRIIMIGQHGDAASDQSICISSPLSGHSCSPIPAQPTQTATYIQHSIPIGSNNSLRKILSSYSESDEFNLNPNGWSEHLREGSFKVFIEFTDDAAEGISATEFNDQLLALAGAPFGTAAEPNYVFHSIVGLEGKDAANPATAHLPTDPIEPNKCSDTQSVSSAPQYQALSVLTGGLRFPLCEPDHYDVIFQQVAEGVVDSVGVPCAFALPTPADGLQADPSRVVVNYSPAGTGTPISLTKVADLASCGADSWYLDTDDNIVLCPDSCATVEADESALIKVLSGCVGPGID